MSSVFWNQPTQTTKLGRCWKRHFCLCHRSDYSPSFQHKFKDNNHGFVFWRHARPLRPENAGENQNQREGKLELQVLLSCIPPANTDTEDRVFFLLVSAVIPAIFSSYFALVPMVCFLCFVIELMDLHQSCFSYGSWLWVCNTEKWLGCWTAVLLTQYLPALLRSSSSPVVPAGAECGAVNEVPRGNIAGDFVAHRSLA